ncbi:MAG TPA: NAD(+) diphosphatase [Jiangellaceae bacterium]|nr:NAD(+) diphosphatase [Jiangellaceae bacterium]
MEDTGPTHALLAPLALARGGVDRAAHRRTDDTWLATAWADRGSRGFVVADGRAPVRDGRLVTASTVGLPPGERFFLGIDGAGVAYFAVHVDGAHPDPDAVSLRRASMVLDGHDGGLMVHAVALSNWHRAHGHCSRCGAATVVTHAGHVRRCPVDGSEHFPRTDPAVIVLVTDEDDRCLLAHSVQNPPGRFSTVAGFVEPGESPEQAVVREVAEETGIVVTSSRYAGSQPWPFPSNLMLGFYARAGGAEPHPDGVEIDEAHWYTRDQLVAALESGELLLSPSASISRRLTEGWFGSELPSTAPTPIIRG